MSKFKIEWTEELWFRAEVEADSAEQAREMLFNGEIDQEAYDGEIQDSVEVTELS